MLASWCTLLITVLERQRQRDFFEFEAGLVYYIESSKPAGYTEKPCPKNKN